MWSGLPLRCSHANSWVIRGDVLFVRHSMMVRAALLLLHDLHAGTRLPS